MPMAKMAGGILLAVFAAILVLVTLMPLSPSNVWWVRLWEFPRLHIFVLALVALALTPFVWRPVRSGVGLAMIAVALWQGWWAWPYAPWAEEQVTLAGRADGAEGTAAPLMLALNVLQRRQGGDPRLPR